MFELNDASRAAVEKARKQTELLRSTDKTAAGLQPAPGESLTPAA